MAARRRVGPPPDAAGGLIICGQMHAPAARAFSSGEPLARERLLGAPVRWPRPSRLLAPLRLPGKRMAAGARTLGLDTVGDLLQHLPSDSRESRTLAELRTGEPATVEVVVRSISARPVRRRGMRPLVEARVADGGGSVRARFFNQPWLVERYPPGTRLLLHGKADGRGGFAVSHHALAAGPPAGDAPAGDTGETRGGPATVAHYPATEGLSSTQILTLVRGARASLEDFPELLPAAVRAGCELPDKPAALMAAHFAEDQDERERARRRLAFEELLRTQLLFLRRRARRHSRTGAVALADPPQLTERWLAEGLPFVLTADQRDAIEEIAADLARTAPMQRLLMGEVGSGKTVIALLRDAARGRARLPGGDDGPHRDAGRAALRDHPAAARLRAGVGGAADGLHAGAQAQRDPRPARKRRAVAGGGHPRADRARRALRRTGGGGRGRAAPLRRAPADGAQRAPGTASATHPAHDRHPDPAHAGAGPLRRPRHNPAARTPRRAPAGAHDARLRRAAARGRLRGAARGAARRTPGIRRVPPDRGGGAGAGRPPAGGRRGAARGPQRAGAGCPRASSPTSAWCCCTGACARARSRRRWPPSPPGPPTC